MMASRRSRASEARVMERSDGLLSPKWAVLASLSRVNLRLSALALALLSFPAAAQISAPTMVEEGDVEQADQPAAKKEKPPEEEEQPAPAAGKGKRKGKAAGA